MRSSSLILLFAAALLSEGFAKNGSNMASKPEVESGQLRIHENVEGTEADKEKQEVKQKPKLAKEDNECPCSVPNIWLDIFFLIDSSTAMTSTGFDYAMAFVQSTLLPMTVGQKLGQNTRVGFITYGDTAELHYNLSHWKSTKDLLSSMNITFKSTRGTNIEAAIRLANANFVEPHHRPNARKVIVIIASAFEPSTFTDPSVQAATFKEDGGVIITLENIQVHGAPVSMLETLATPGYALSNRDSKIEVWMLHQLFCRANCFCPMHYRAYSIKDTVPRGGCYRKSMLPAVQELAEISCRRHYKGVIATVDSQEKARFLLKVIRPAKSLWIGMRYIENSYTWYSDQNIANPTFKMWAPKYPDQQQGICVKMMAAEDGETKDYSGFWYNERCRKDLLYICQVVACSTENYCPLIR
ncbi:hypothetical protein Q1695_015743 [Nippostrongylus brasiliensis]|nr:hypothetical protein Q1695_015743 [Nippostrongylus brasiliensis]